MVPYNIRLPLNHSLCSQYTMALRCVYIYMYTSYRVKNSDRERDVSWERLGGGLYDEGLEGGRLVVGDGVH